MLAHRWVSGLPVSRTLVFARSQRLRSNGSFVDRSRDMPHLRRGSNPRTERPPAVCYGHHADLDLSVAVALHRRLPLSPEPLQLPVHLVHRELLRGELPTDPFHHLGVALVFRVAERFKEVAIAPETSH